MASYAFDPNEDMSARRRRRKSIAELLAEQADAKPIQSPWQGAAKMANAGISGLLLGMEEKRDEDRLTAQNAYGTKLSEELAGLGGGGGGGSPVTSALAGKPIGGPIKLGGFEPTLGRTLEFEGGVNPRDTNGTPSVHGINQKANPDVDLERVKTDPAYRAEVYRNRYWNTIDGDKLDPRVAHVAFDTSVIAGPGKARELLKASGGDPEKFLALREAFQNRLLAANPEKYGPYAKAWANRVATLRSDVGVGGGQPGGMMAVGGGGDTTLAGGDTLQGRGAPSAARLMEIATDRNAPPEMRERAKLMLQSMPKPRDPLEERAKILQIQKAERDLNPEAPTPLTPEERQQLGIRPDIPAYRQGKEIKFGPAGTSISNTVSAGDKADGTFRTENAKAISKRFNDMSDEGGAAQAELAQIRFLRENLGQLPGGFLGGAQALASQYGIKLGPNTSNIEAAQAIISKLVPTQKAPGSGTISDADLALFKSSLPALSNTPAGNALILDTMEGLALHKQKQSEIATAVLLEEKTPKEALQELRALPDPLAAATKAIRDSAKSKGSPKAGAGSPPAGVSPAEWKAMTDEERALWK